MDRTVVECLTPSAPCAECEERDCCRDERRVAQIRTRVAELESDLADADEVRTRRCNELIRDSNDYARMMEQRINAAESRASAAEQRVSELETRLQIDPGGSDKIDELEQAAQFLRHELDVTRTELGLKRSDCVRLGMDCDALKGEKKAAEQRVKRMEGALRPFAEAGRIYEIYGRGEDAKFTRPIDPNRELARATHGDNTIGLKMADFSEARAALAASGTEKPRCVCVGAECHHLTGGPCACGCQTPWDESQEDNEE